MKNRTTLLSTLWLFALLNYLYCDVLSLMDAGTLKGYLAGQIGGIKFTQGFLLGAGILMEIPIAMVLLARFLPFKINRFTNLRRISVGLAAAVLLAALFGSKGIVSAATLVRTPSKNQAKTPPVVRNPPLANKDVVKKASDKEPDYVKGEVVVKYKKDKVDLKSFFGPAKAFVWSRIRLLEKKKEIKSQNVQVFKSKKSTEDLIKDLKKDGNVEYVEPNYLRRPMEISSDDTYRGRLWGLDNTGQTVNGTTGTADADIDAPEAWAVSEGDSSVIVAVIDTGVAYNHPDLLANMWDGSSCLDENGNALGGCNYGYDFVDDDKTPLPSNSTHGTHVAGTIAAIKGNTRGIIGVAPNTKIMALKFGLDSVSEAQAIDFAIQNGAKVINASYGGGSFSTTEYDAISRFQAAGGVFVAAAGNSARNNDSSSHTYPSDYNLDNIISVAATDQNDALASFSNYGATSVDVGAPGVNIYSTVPSETSVLSEDFEGVVAPAVPVGWTATGNWGTYTFPSTTVLYGDTNYPYVAGANSTITSPTYDLSAVSGVGMSFWAQCDTEYSLTSWTDYMALELSSNGSTYTEYTRWDEPYLDGLNGDADPTGAAIYQFDLSLPNSYYTSNFKFRYRWVSNSSDNSYDGCWVDDVAITSLSDGTDEEYGFMNGTSMASPHVAGLVALAWEVKPTLTIAQVKNRILSTGDAIPALSGITVSERRINAFNAINNINTAPVVVDGSDYVSMDSSVILTLSGSDVDDDTLTYSIVSDVSNGTLGSIVGNQVVYTPTTSYLGPDSFTFKANDGVVDSNTGTMTLTVNPAVTITDVTNTTPTTTTVTVTWTTDYPSTSRVLYDTTSHPSPGAAPNYGYFLSTTESDVSPKVTSHSVGLTGLLPETKYYFRVVGFGTPEILSEEGMFTMATGPRVSVPEPPKKGPPVCSDTKPASSPDLFQINVASSTARLFFTPIANTDKFYISFSTNPSAEEHGGQVTLSYHGVQTITVNYLKSSTVYYFKVRGQNGCMPGDWSNIFKVTTRARGTMGTISAYRYTPPKPAPEKTVRRRR